MKNNIDYWKGHVHASKQILSLIDDEFISDARLLRKKIISIMDTSSNLIELANKLAVEEKLISDEKVKKE